MTILDKQISDYLRLQGRLPEMFLLQEILGRTKTEAEEIIKWREQEMLSSHPAVVAIKVIAERARQRKVLKMPAVENEEVTITDEGTRIQSVTVQGMADIRNGKVDLGQGASSIPPGLHDAFKRKLLEQLDGGVKFAHFHAETADGPGTLTLPDGTEMHFDSPQAFIEAMNKGEIDFTQEDTDGGEPEDD